MTNRPDYKTTFHGVDITATNRLSDRWMARASFGCNFAREFFGDNPRTEEVNPTRRDTDPLVEGGQFAERSSGSGAGDIFVNNKWNLNLNASHLFPWYDIQAAGNLFGKQSTPFPIFVAAPLGLDGSERVLVTEDLDSERFDNLWDLDLRVPKDFNLRHLNAEFIAGLFNVFNENTELQRERNLASENFGRLHQNLSPRIVRFGLRLRF